MLVTSSRAIPAPSRRRSSLAAACILLSLGLSAADHAARIVDGPPERVMPVALGDLPFDCLLRRLMGFPCPGDLPEPEPETDPEPGSPTGPVNPLI